MYHVLIVDDEAHSVRGLQAGVRWENLNIGTVHTAHSLRQAQVVFHSNPVHLMVCDIEMPQGSGLELLQWVREFHPQTETIFLTCHSDFSFAKQAIQLNSFDYLLKPVDYSELEEVLSKAIEKIRKERELLSFEETYKHYLHLWESHQPMIAERFWQDLIQQAIPSTPNMIREHVKKSGLSYKETTRFMPIYIRVQNWHKPLTQRDERIMEYALRNAAEEEITRNERRAAVISVKNSTLLAIIPSESEFVKLNVQLGCDAYIRSCNQFFYCDLCCYIGKPVMLHEMVGMLGALQELDENNVTLTNRTLSLEDVKKPDTPIQAPPMTEWAEWMKQGAREKLSADVMQYLASWRDIPQNIDAKMLHMFYQDFLQMIFFVLHSKGLQANQVFADNLLTVKPESVLRSLAILEEWVQFVLGVAMNHIHSTQENMSIVDKVKRFIADSIGQQNLSREDIASHVFLNPDYLSRVFKKESGIAISDYLVQQRIEYAKVLLSESTLSVSDIALEVGYSNLSYFSTIFKKATGINPNDFRKNSKLLK